MTVSSHPRPRLSKYGREVAPIAERCGYQFDRQAGGHYVFTQPGFPNFVIPSTPSDSRAFANDIARLKRRHPDQFERAKSLNPLSKDQRRERANRRSARASIALLTPAGNGNGSTPDAPIELIHPPGSDEAIAAGCICGAYENNHGVGIDGQPGVFAYVMGCPYADHSDDIELPPNRSHLARCPCGNKLPQRKKGRPRKWCFSCRPSQWDRATEEQRARAREAVRRWYWKHVEQEEAA